MDIIIVTIICVAILIFLIHEAYMAWFKSEKYLEKIQKWHANLPPYLASMANEKWALWQVRIGTPIVIVIFSCFILAVISLIE